MSLKNKLLAMAGKLGDRLPIIEAEKEKEKHRKWLKAVFERGETYVGDNACAEGEYLSNQSLIERGAPYSLKTGVIKNATYIDGGIGGDSIESPFIINYGRSHQHIRPKSGLHDLKKSLSLLVTADFYRVEDRVEEAACLVEFAKYFIDELSSFVGFDEQQRQIHFNSRNQQVHTPIYEAIGARALRIADKCLSLHQNTQIAREMYELAQDCQRQSEMPIDKIERPFTQKKASMAA